MTGEPRFLTEYEAYQAAFLTCRGWVILYKDAGYWTESGKKRLALNETNGQWEETDHFDLAAAFHEETRT